MNTNIDYHQPLTIKESTLSVDMDGERVAMNIENDQTYGINDLGSTIWNMIEKKPLNTNDILLILKSQYNNIDESQLSNDLDNFIRKGLEAELIGYG